MIWHLLYVCPLPLEPQSRIRPHPTPLGCQRALALGSLCHTAGFRWLSTLYMVICTFQRCSFK